MVWTSETGILAVAVELSRWPPIWKKARGSVVMMTSLLGSRMGCRNADILVRRTGKMLASQERKMQSEDTKANWINVKVAGMSKALRMDFDDVLVRADEVYHMTQRTCKEEINFLDLSHYHIQDRM